MSTCFHYSDEACYCSNEPWGPEYHCAYCGEADIIEALDPIYVASPQWHRVEKLCHPECREMFVRDNLGAVLESLRLAVVS